MMRISPLPLDSPKAQQAAYRHSLPNSQVQTPKSVSFSFEHPLTPSKGFPRSSKNSYQRDQAFNFSDGLSTFYKKNRCKVLFQVVDDKGKAKLELANKGNSPKESLPLMTDSFQYRTEGLLEEEDLVLDITQNKNLIKKASDLDVILGLWKGTKHKKNNLVLEKTQPRMRRKSDTSSWSGGASELERKTFFSTFEYVAKPVNVQTDGATTVKDIETVRNSRLVWKMDGSPVNYSRKSTQSRLKQLSKIALDMEKGGKDKEQTSALRHSCTLRDPLLRGDSLGPEPELSNVESKINNLSEEDMKSKENLIGSVTQSKLPEYQPHSKVPALRRSLGSEKVYKKAEVDLNDSIRIKNSYKPYRPVKPVDSKGGSSIKRSRVFEKSSVSSSAPQKMHKNHRSTGSLLMKKPEMKNQSTSGNSAEEQHQKKEDEREKRSSEQASPNKIKAMLKLHQTLVKNIYGNQKASRKLMSQNNSVVSIKGISLDEKSRSPPRTPGKEKKKSFWNENSVSVHHQSQQIELPRLDPRKGPMVHSSAKNSVEKTQQVKHLELGKKGKLGRMLSPSSANGKAGRFEKLENSCGDSFRPKISGPAQLMMRYAPCSPKFKCQEL